MVAHRISRFSAGLLILLITVLYTFINPFLIISVTYLWSLIGEREEFASLYVLVGVYFIPAMLIPTSAYSWYLFGKQREGKGVVIALIPLVILSSFYFLALMIR